jgi:hypothetical protein
MGPTLDWTCSQCGAMETWELVRADESGRQGERPTSAPADPHTLDFSCSRCGTTETWMLVSRGVEAGSARAGQATER